MLNCFFSCVSDPSPTDLSIVNKTNSEVTIQWTNIHTCYERVRSVIYLNQPDNTTMSFIIDKDLDMFTFVGLSPGVTYTIDMYTEYGNSTHFVRSLDPLHATFDTGKNHS